MGSLLPPFVWHVWVPFLCISHPFLHRQICPNLTMNMLAIAGGLTLLARVALASKECPELALSLVLDGSGSIHKSASSMQLTLNGWSRTKGKDAVTALADSILDKVRDGRKDKSKERYGSLWFDNQAYEVIGMTDNFVDVKERTRKSYKPRRGCTNIKAAIEKSVEQLSKAPAELPKLMVLVSDGEPTVGGTDGVDNQCDAGDNDLQAAIDAAEKARANGVTIVAIGFSDVQQSSLEKIATCTGCAMKQDSIDGLTDYIQNQLCDVKVPTPAATPQPTAQPDCDTDGKKDKAWDDCLGGLCKPGPDGRSVACIKKKDENKCDDVDFWCPCTCTCCPKDLTPAPTPQSDLNCEVDFAPTSNFSSNWLSADLAIKSFLKGSCEYDYEKTWKEMIEQGHVLVERKGTRYRFDDTQNGILKEPFENPTKVLICMPAGWENVCQKQGLGSSAPASEYSLVMCLVLGMAMSIFW